MSRKPLTRTELDDALFAYVGSGGGESGESLGLFASCHREAALHVWYLDGVLVLRCAQCAGIITVVAVAPGEPRIVS
jgi:Uri superfamily endonuclease